MNDSAHQATQDQTQLVSFHLGNEEFGIDILKVQEINHTVNITAVPQAPDCVEGVVNLRGKILPVLNLSKKLGLPPKEWTKETRIIVCDVDGKVIGFVVDSVSQILRIEASSVQPAPDLVTSVDTGYMTGVVKLDDHLLIYLDTSKLAHDVGGDVNWESVEQVAAT